MNLQQLALYSAAATGLLVFLSVMVLALTWLERKALARIQMRMGPMRVGFHGALQPIADALKLVTKEDILPSWADRRVYWLAPIAVFVPALLLWVTIPVTRDLVLRNLDLGLFYIVADVGAFGYGPRDGRLGVGEQVRHTGRVARGGSAHQLRDTLHHGHSGSGYAGAVAGPACGRGRAGRHRLHSDSAAGRVHLPAGGPGRTGKDAVRHSPRRVRGGWRAVRGVQRCALGRLLPRRIHQHLHNRRADGVALPGRLAMAGHAVRWPWRTRRCRWLGFSSRPMR